MKVFSFVTLLVVFSMSFGVPVYAQPGPFPAPGTPPIPSPVPSPAPAPNQPNQPNQPQQPGPGAPQQPQQPGVGGVGAGQSGGIGAGAGGQTLGDLITRGIVLIELAIPIILMLATLAFFVGAAQFIFSAGSEEKRRHGKQLLIWGVVVLFIIVSIWGIILVIQSTFGLR